MKEESFFNITSFEYYESDSKIKEVMHYIEISTLLRAEWGIKISIALAEVVELIVAKAKGYELPDEWLVYLNKYYLEIKEEGTCEKKCVNG